MATHDYVLDNATGANFRSDLNNALAAIVSNNSSSSEPSTKYAYQWWADTNEGVLKIRNSSNDGWVTLLQLDGTLTLEDGSASAPALGFRDDLNTGIFSSAADNLDITTGGTTRVNVSSTGINVTGTVTDDGAVHDGNVDLNGNIDVSGTSTLNDDVTFTGANANLVFDKSADSLKFADSVFAIFGTGGDLQVYHDGTHSHIRDVGTGDLRFRSSSIQSMSTTSEAMISAVENSGVQLYFDNSKKLETYTSGIEFFGNIKNETDGTNQGIFLGAANDLQLYHDGTRSAINNRTGDLRLLGAGNIRLGRADSGNTTSQDELYIECLSNDEVALYYNNTKRFKTVDNGAQVIGTIFVPDGGSDSGQNHIRFGDDGDLRIFHDGSHSIIKDAGTGNLRVQTNNLRIENAAGTENQLLANENSAIKLYFDNSKKAETVSGGFTITGTCTATAFSGDGSGLTGVSGGGKILQVVAAEITNTASTSSSSFQDTNIEANITPSASSSKVLVMIDAPFHVFRASGTSNSMEVKVLRDGNDITDTITTQGTHQSGIGSGAISSNRSVGVLNKIILDSPSSTSQLTYKMTMAGFSGNTVSFQDGSKSHITLLEVGA